MVKSFQTSLKFQFPGNQTIARVANPRKSHSFSIMTFQDALKNHCPYITPEFFKGIDPMTIKACMESKIWRLRNFQGLPPTFVLEEIEQYIGG